MPRSDLRADCARCAALCCTATSFDPSEDFAFAKEAGAPCPHLAGRRCSIHDDLAGRGMRGCAIYDCHGAGPRVTAAVVEDRDAAFLVVRVLCELVWLLDEARRFGVLGARIDDEIATLDAILDAPSTWRDVDLGARRRSAHGVLQAVGRVVGGRARLVVVNDP